MSARSHTFCNICACLFEKLNFHWANFNQDLFNQKVKIFFSRVRSVSPQNVSSNGLFPNNDLQLFDLQLLLGYGGIYQIKSPSYQNERFLE